MNAKNEIIKIGICGLGRSGYGIHCKAIREMTDRFSVHGVYDPISDRKLEVADEFGAKAYSDFKSMLSDPDIKLVIVASPNKYHSTHAIQVWRQASMFYVKNRSVFMSRMLIR